MIGDVQTKFGSISFLDCKFTSVRREVWAVRDIKFSLIFKESNAFNKWIDSVFKYIDGDSTVEYKSELMFEQGSAFGCFPTLKGKIDTVDGSFYEGDICCDYIDPRLEKFLEDGLDWFDKQDEHNRKIRLKLLGKIMSGKGGEPVDIDDLCN